MSSSALVTEKKYEGKYVALESFVNNRVVASGNVLTRVLNTAKKLGVPTPVIVFVQKENMGCIY